MFPLLAVSGEGLSWGASFWYLLGITFFVFMNAIFVGSEFAIARLRLSQLETYEGGKKKLIQSILTNLDEYLSACQLGITLSSLALGFLGEPFVAELLSPLLQFIPGISETMIHFISLIIAYSAFTFLHVVLGEMLPKSLAIRKPLTVAVWLSLPLFYFYIGFRWLLKFFNGATNFLLRRFFGVSSEDLGKENHHSPEELAILLANGEGTEEVTDTERKILINALELNDLQVKDIFTPRTDLVIIDVEQSFEEARKIVIRSKHTRFPLVNKSLDDFLGFVHVKDLFTLLDEKDSHWHKISRKLNTVPEMMPLDGLLKFFLKEKAHLALVVDEFGVAVGAVFLDDVIEELVGDIQDEFDLEQQPNFVKITEREFLINADMFINELSEYLDTKIFKDTEASTIGGYVVEKFERLPKSGDMMDINGYRVKIVRANDRRIEKILLTQKEKTETSDGDSGS